MSSDNHLDMGEENSRHDVDSDVSDSKGWLKKLQQVAGKIINVSNEIKQLKKDNHFLHKQVKDLSLKIEKQAGYIERMDKFISVPVENEVRKQLND